MKIPVPVKKRVRIEIIPLIDIVFFLLATFAMVSLSMVKNESVPVHLPSAKSSVAQDTQDGITVTVKENGDLLLNKDPVSFFELSQRLKQRAQGNPDIRVLINGDEKAYFGKAISVLDQVRLLGITKVSIRTRGKA